MDKSFSSASVKDAIRQQRREITDEEERRDAALDEALGFTFPASDPVALNCSVTAFLPLRRTQARLTISFFKSDGERSRS